MELGAAVVREVAKMGGKAKLPPILFDQSQVRGRASSTNMHLSGGFVECAGCLALK